MTSMDAFKYLLESNLLVLYRDSVKFSSQKLFVVNASFIHDSFTVIQSPYYVLRRDSTILERNSMIHDRI